MTKKVAVASKRGLLPTPPIPEMAWVITTTGCDWYNRASAISLNASSRPVKSVFRDFVVGDEDSDAVLSDGLFYGFIFSCYLAPGIAAR